MNDDNRPVEHVSVLAEEIAERIELPTDGVLIDATVGHGGHSYLLGQKLGPEGTILGLDVDENCIEKARGRLDGLACRVILDRENFANVAGMAEKHAVGKANLILADLGFCSGQLEDTTKGLSFRENMPLDMRLDSRLRVTAADIINDTDEKTLADLIYEYSQERASRRIARFIVQYRASWPIKTTAQLSMIVCKALNKPLGGTIGRIHPATRTFQALRIAVNDELGCLEKLLAAGLGLLRQGGYISVISFHSLEDRIVKNDFKQNRACGAYEIITAKPITPSRTEIKANPRARSAKLRIARRN